MNANVFKSTRKHAIIVCISSLIFLIWVTVNTCGISQSFCLHRLACGFHWNTHTHTYASVSHYFYPNVNASYATLPINAHAHIVQYDLKHTRKLLFNVLVCLFSFRSLVFENSFLIVCCETVRWPACVQTCIHISCRQCGAINENNSALLLHAKA